MVPFSLEDDLCSKLTDIRCTDALALVLALDESVIRSSCALGSLDQAAHPRGYVWAVQNPCSVLLHHKQEPTMIEDLSYPR